MDKKNAEEILRKIIDYCVQKGGIFTDAASVSAAMQAIETLADNAQVEVSK